MPASLIPDRTETLVPRPASATSPASPEADRQVAVDHLAADDPDRYEQVNEHARGGLGRVVRAVDRRLGRTVAVKELLRHDPSNEARFMREAMITARLEHPGIVPVHEAGRWPNGDPYYVMKLVEGRTLKELICETATVRERLGLLHHVIAVADAVGYAHSEGVIHRDLKPSNVIVGSFGETIVVDWGLARDRKRDLPEPTAELITTAGSGVSTVSGKVVGTPAYMSPEQARGDVVDERADVYALGAVLYEVLAGTPPHADTTPQAVLERVIAGPPRPLSMVVSSVPDELCTIVRKAMARDPAARYPNAVALAEDLRRFTTGKLVSAHSYSTWALVRKRLARHRGVVAVAIASLLVLGAVGVASVRRVVAERNIARRQRGLAEEALASAQKRKRELVLLQAETALPKDPTAALAWLKTYDVGPDDRGAVVDVIDEALALGVARHVFRPGDWVYDARFSADGNTLVAAVRDGFLRTYDLRTGGTVELGPAPSALETLVLSADGELAISGGLTGEVIAWPLHGGAPRKLVNAGGRTISALRLSRDGHLLIEREASAPQVLALDGWGPAPAGSAPAWGRGSIEGGKAELLAPTSGLRFAVADDDWSRVVMVTSANEVAVAEHGAKGSVRSLAHTAKAISFLAISPRGDTVVVHDGTTIWSVAFAGGPLHEVARYSNRLNTVVWSPDGRIIAIGGVGPEILLADTKTGEVRELRGHTDAIYTLEFTRDGTHLLSASDDSTARVWNVANRTAVVLRGHDDDVYRARFSADERSVVTSSLDGSARVWSLDRPSAEVRVEGEPIEGLRFDGDHVTIRTSDAITRWDLASAAREVLFSWANEPHNLGNGVASADGAHIAIPNADGSMELRGRDGRSIALRGHRGMINHVEFSRDGGTVFSSSSDGTLRRWDVATGTGTIQLQGDVPVRGFAVARDGRIAAQAGNTAFLIDPGGMVRRLGGGGKWCVDFAEFEPVGDRLVLHRCDKSLALVEDGRVPGQLLAGESPRIIELPTGDYMVGHVAVSPDGRRIAGGLSDRTVRLWDAGTGQVIDILRGHSDVVMDVAFSPDGRELASASYDKTIRIWDLASKRHRVLRGHTAPVDWVRWRGPAQLATGSPDGTIRIWNAPGLELPSGEDLSHELETATTARIDLDRPASGNRSARGT
jgi:eukaryotic-like serine/threonine-protein kinase